MLHMGMGKTGSSALQVAFARFRDQLSTCGINYPAHSSDAAAIDGKVVSGNGMGIIEAVGPRTHDPDEALRSEAELFEESTKVDFHTTLYSSEFLFMFSPGHVQSLQRNLAERGVRLQAIVYVRNMAGHAVSSYSQAVKRKLYTGTFREYIDRGADGPYRPVVRRKLELLLEHLGVENVHVLHYDTVRDRLVPDFFETVLGVDPTVLDQHVASERINRSLTREEVALMRNLNRSLSGKRQAHMIGDVVIAQAPLGSEPLTISSEDFELLRGYYESDMAWVNEVFFPGSGRAGVSAEDVRVSEDEPAELALSRREQFLVSCLVDLTKRQAGSVRAAK